MLKAILQKQKFLLLSILVMILWGSLFPMVKLGYREFSLDTAFIPNILLFAGIRFTICGGIVSTFCRVKYRSQPVSGSSLIRILCVGLFAVVLHYTCTYWGLSLTDSTKTAMLKQLAVFVFIPFSFLFFKTDRFSVQKLLGAVLGFGGVVVLNLNSGHFSLGAGELLVMGASVCTVASNVLGKKVMAQVPSLMVTGYSQLAGGIVLLLLGWLTGGRIEYISGSACLVLFYICLASIISYSAWYYTVSNGDLSKLFIIKFLEPMFAGVFGALLLGENIWRWEYLVSLLLIGVAVWITHEKSHLSAELRRPNKKEEAIYVETK